MYMYIYVHVHVRILCVYMCVFLMHQCMYICVGVHINRSTPHDSLYHEDCTDPRLLLNQRTSQLVVCLLPTVKDHTRIKGERGEGGGKDKSIPERI